MMSTADCTLESGKGSYHIPANSEPCDAYGPIPGQQGGPEPFQASIRGDLPKGSHYIWGIHV